MPARASQVSEILADAGEPCKKGAVLPFTRHPRLLARVHRLRLQSCAHRVLEVLLTYADAEGVCWPQPDEIVQLMPRSARVDVYSMASVLRALRTLRELGWLAWTTVPPLGRFPGRRRGRLVPRGGRWTQSGGRVWALNLEKLRGQALTRPSLSSIGTESGGAITHDRPGTITHDRPSDPWFSLRENKIDPARQRGAAPARASGASVASETPSAATTRRREPGESPTPAPDASPAAARDAASETPGSASTVPSSRSGQAARRDVSNEGKEQIVSHARRQRVGLLPTSSEVQEAAFAKLSSILGVPIGRLRR